MSKKKTGWDVGELYDPMFQQMEKQSLKDTLESVAYNVDEGNYTIELTDEMLNGKREELAEISIKIHELEETKKNLMAEMKALLKEPTEIKHELLTVIKHKSEFRNGTLFYVDDQDDNRMYKFNDEGICVESRPLRKEERQTKIKTLNNVANG